MSTTKIEGFDNSANNQQKASIENIGIGLDGDFAKANEKNMIESTKE